MSGFFEGYLLNLEAQGGNATQYCERAIVGALLIDCGQRAHVRALSGREFSDVALGRVFDMVMDIDGPVDLVVALAEAEKRGMATVIGSTGLSVYLASLLDLIPCVDNVEGYAKYIKRAAVAREVEKMRFNRAAERVR